MTTGGRITKARKHKDLTQEKLADAPDVTLDSLLETFKRVL